MKKSTVNPFDLAEVFARNKALFGDLRMEAGEDAAKNDEPGSTENDEGKPDDKPTEGGDENKGEGENEEKKDDDKESTLSHEDALSALAATRKEAASYRTKYQDAMKRLDGAKSPEEVQQIVDELTTKHAEEVRELQVTNLALQYEIPKDLHATLRSLAVTATPEELEGHAKALAKHAVPAKEINPDELDGGLNPGQNGDAVDPVALARAARRRR